MKFAVRLLISALLSSAVLSAPILPTANKMFSSIGFGDLLASATGEATSSAGATEEVGLGAASAPEDGAVGGTAAPGGAVSFGVTSDLFGAGGTPGMQNMGSFLNLPI